MAMPSAQQVPQPLPALQMTALPEEASNNTKQNIRPTLEPGTNKPLSVDQCRDALASALREAGGGKVLASALREVTGGNGLVHGCRFHALADGPEVAAACSAELRLCTGAAHHNAAELSALLARRALPLRRKAARLATDLSNLGVEAGQQVVAADQCLVALRDRVEALRAQLVEIRNESVLRAESLKLRHATLEDEVHTLEWRSKRKNGTATGSCANGPTWAEMSAERCAQLRNRIASAEARHAPILDLANEGTRLCEARLAELREAHRELEDRAGSIQAASSAGPTDLWRSRFEALIAAQGMRTNSTLAMSTDHRFGKLDMALETAFASLQDAVDGAKALPPKQLVGAIRCVQGLADVERRRCMLLTKQWRVLQGDDPRTLVGGYSAPSPTAPIRCFSPPRALDWDLDICRSKVQIGVNPLGSTYAD